MKRITYLINQRVTGQLSDAEAHELDELLTEDNREAITAIMAELLAADNNVLTEDRAGWEQRIREVVSIDLPLPVIKPVHRVHFIRRWGWVAAVVLLSGIGVYFWKSNKKDISQSAIPESIADIAPVGNRATLTVGDGKPIDLQKNGIVIASDAIIYNDGERIADAGQILTLTTPRGGQYQVVLPDGTKVWLNAESSIRFPSKVSAGRRPVEVSGEVYMEVAQNAQAPFSVKAGNMMVQVLGTAFNIKAYPDEETQRMTLVSGSVKVMATDSKNQKAAGSSYNQSAIIIRPGQQAQVSITKEKPVTVRTTNIEQDIAWKNGLINFEGVPFGEIMKQLERCYDIDVVYENNTIPNYQLSGAMTRDVPLNGLLKNLEKLGIHYKLRNRTLTISP